MTHVIYDLEKLTGGREIAEINYSAGQIAERVSALGAEIGEYYPDGELLVVGLLKGSFVFLADLVRHIPRPHHVDFLVASSYGTAQASGGAVQLLYDPETELAGKHILLVEDIIETGNTINRLVRLLMGRSPASLEVCALLDKHMAPAREREPRFVGFDAPPVFLVGYGLDHAEDFRHLPFVATIKG